MHPLSLVAEGGVRSKIIQKDLILHPDQGGGIEEKPHQRIQTGVLSAGRNRPKTPRPALSRAQSGRERAAQMAQGVRGKGRRGLHREEAALLSRGGSVEARVAELERFCGKLALENEILKKGLSRHHSGGGTP